MEHKMDVNGVTVKGSKLEGYVLAAGINLLWNRIGEDHVYRESLVRELGITEDQIWEVVEECMITLPHGPEEE